MAYLGPRRTKPLFKHALVQGVLALGIVLLFTSGHAWEVTARITVWILDAVGLRTVYFRPLFMIYVRLMDGTLAGFQILAECSGLLTVVIFSFISTFTIGLLRGSILSKSVCFLLSVGVGFLWNINRLVLVIIMAYNFGLSASFFIHYLLGPFIDFLWVVSMWSLGMSVLKGQENLA